MTKYIYLILYKKKLKACLVTFPYVLYFHLSLFSQDKQNKTLDNNYQLCKCATWYMDLDLLIHI